MLRRNRRRPLPSSAQSRRIPLSGGSLLPFPGKVVGIMRTRIRAAVRPAATIRSASRLPATVLGLLAVVAGILGMHLVTDLGSPAAHAASAPHSPLAASALSAMPTLQTHSAFPAAEAAPEDGGHADHGCANCGPSGCLTAACLLFLLLTGLGGIIPGFSGKLRFRGPGRLVRFLSPVSATLPRAPSLVQLCISRT